MTFLPSQRLRLAALVAVALGLAASGIGYASIPDSEGVIHGCYNTSVAHGSPTGALRVIDTAKGQVCAPYENALSWSSATGPSSRLAVGSYGMDIATGNVGTVMANLQLPAGSYTLDASGWVTSATGFVYVACYITTNDAAPNIGVDPSAFTAVQDTGIRQTTISLTGVATLTNPGSAQVQCVQYGGVGASAGQMYLRATTAGQVSVSVAAPIHKASLPPSSP